MEKPFNVQVIVRQKHGDLYTAMKRMGWNQRELSEYLGISQQVLGRLMNFSGKPPRFRGSKARQKRFKERLMKLTGKTYEDLFPGEVYNDEALRRAKGFDFTVEKDLATLKLEPASEATLEVVPSRGVTPADLATLAGLAKECLTAIEWEVISMRYFMGMTLLEIGDNLGVTRERIRRIEVVALRRLARRLPIGFRSIDSEADESEVALPISVKATLTAMQVEKDELIPTKINKLALSG